MLRSAAIAARLSYVSRRHRLPVVATKTAGVSAKGLHGDGGGGDKLAVAAAALGGEGEVQLQQREFMPMPWQVRRTAYGARGVSFRIVIAQGVKGRQCGHQSRSWFLL
jgi:hypothetical protein